MEKQESNQSPGDGHRHDLKADIQLPAVEDVALGDVLAVEPTPEEERRVVRKLDLM